MPKFVINSNLVICAFAGAGKTQLQAQQPSRVLELCTANYNWPAVKARVRRYPANFVAAVVHRKEVVLTGVHKDVRDCLSASKVPFVLCYPRLDEKRAYLDRYEAMGKDPAFIRMMDIMWCDMIGHMRQDTRANKHIELEKGKFLADAVEFA